METFIKSFQPTYLISNSQPHFSQQQKCSNDVLTATATTASKCSDIMSIEDQTKTLDGYATTMKIITVEPGGLTNDHSNKARLIINFGEHGRELISPEIAIRLLETLCNEEARRALLKAYGISIDVVDSLLNKVVYKIIPVENPGGRELVEGGALCERKKRPWRRPK